MILISFVWLIVRLHLYFVGYLSADGIMPYYFFGMKSSDAVVGFKDLLLLCKTL